jgi:hypothetical protein
MALQADEPCPFDLGSRVTHRLYGTGTVTGSPGAVMVMSPSSLQLVPEGWRMEISWDNSCWAPCRVSARHLTLAVPRPA